MKKTLVAASAAAALLAGGLAPVFAQPETKGKPAAERSEGERRHGPRLSAEDRAAFTASRLAALKAGLQLTSAQEAHWGALETALRSIADERDEEREQRRGERTRPDVLQMLDLRVERLRAQADQLTKVTEASKPLYDSLDDAQKRRFGVLLRDALPQGPHQGPGFGGPGPHHNR